MNGNQPKKSRRLSAIIAAVLPLAVLAAVLLTGCGGPKPAGETLPLPEETARAGNIAGGLTGEPRETVDIMESPPPPEEIEPESGISVELVPPDDALVRLKDYIPDILVDLKYATADNFTGVVIYDFTDAYLRYGTVKKLAEVQEELRELGMGLKVWDAFRPAAAQFQLWEVCPDPAYVADPNTGYSSHSTGNTVDLTLAWSDGAELQMPTGFDDFSRKADRDYSDCDEISAGNAGLLEDLMRRHGFQPYFGEWWHFSDATPYAVEAAFEPPAS